MYETLTQIKDRMEKQRKDDAEYLKNCLTKTSKQFGLGSPGLWYASNDTLLSVATILEGECLFTASDAIRFFEKPNHFEQDMKEFIESLDEA